MRRPEHVIKPADKRAVLVSDGVLVNAELLLVQRALGDAIMVEQPGLRRPAEMEGGAYVMCGPFHHLPQLIPVVNLLKLQLLDRGPGDDEAVVFSLPYPAERRIEGAEMLLGSVPAFVRLRMQEVDLDLERAVGQPPEEMELCLLLLRHQVENHYLQGPDVLVDGPDFRHHEDVFLLEVAYRRQAILYFDGHRDGVLSGSAGSLFVVAMEEWVRPVGRVPSHCRCRTLQHRSQKRRCLGRNRNVIRPPSSALQPCPSSPT